MKELKKTPAWFGIDSLHGRYLTGTAEEIAGGIIQPKETVAIVEPVYTLFKAERLFVQESCASSFLIRNVFAGQQRGAILGYSPILAEPFKVRFEALAELKLALDDKNLLKIEVDKSALDFIGAPFPLPTLNPGLQLTFEIENIGPKPVRFLGALLGVAIF